MKSAVRYSILIVLMCPALAAFAEQKKCIVLNSGGDMDEFRDSIAETCSPGDVLYFRDNFGTDIRVLLAATACDFSKNIIMDDDELACIYNGLKGTR